MEEWFRWVVGGVLALYAAVTGWFAHIILGNRDKIAVLKERLAVLESRPSVNPIDYATAMANMAGVITALTSRLAEYQLLSQQQYQERLKSHEKVEKHLDIITEVLLAIKATLANYATRSGGPSR